MTTPDSYIKIDTGVASRQSKVDFDFSKFENPESELERLREWQFISEAEANSVNLSALKEFFASNLFRRILNAKSVNREMRFLTELPAKSADNTLNDKFSNENIIVQGAVDVCFEEEDGIVILDFKTDRTDNPEDLANAYKEQLQIYAYACEKIFKKPVKEMIIYSFNLCKEIVI